MSLINSRATLRAFALLSESAVKILVKICEGIEVGLPLRSVADVCMASDPLIGLVRCPPSSFRG